MKQPLFGMEFMIIGATVKPKDEIENKIKRMGGNLIEKIHEKVAAIISTPEEVSKMGPVMEEAKTIKIHVVPETYIDDVKNIDPLELIVMSDLSKWGQDVCSLVPSIQLFDCTTISIHIIFHFSLTSVCHN